MGKMENVSEFVKRKRIKRKCAGCGMPMDIKPKSRLTIPGDEDTVYYILRAQRVFVNVAHNPPIKEVVCEEACKYPLAAKLRKKYGIKDE
jgi:hypothetical protein